MLIFQHVNQKCTLFRHGEPEAVDLDWATRTKKKKGKIATFVSVKGDSHNPADSRYEYIILLLYDPPFLPKRSELGHFKRFLVRTHTQKRKREKSCYLATGKLSNVHLWSMSAIWECGTHGAINFILRPISPQNMT